MEKVYHRSNKVEWETPQYVFDELNKEFGFTLDPCATQDNAKCDFYYTKEDDGLSHDWAPHTVFCNPPYGKKLTLMWMQKAYNEWLKGATVVCLIPARTDTIAWHEYAMKAREIRLIKGRLKFIDEDKVSKDPAGFPSAIVVFANPVFKSVQFKSVVL